MNFALNMNFDKSRQVLDCASPLALWESSAPFESARGLAHSRTLARDRKSLLRFVVWFHSPRLAALLMVSIPIVALVGCSRSGEKEASPKEAEEQSSRVKQGTNGVTVTLDAETQKVIGLQTATLEAAQLNPEIKCYGRVIDPATLSATMADFASARATAEASQKELDRLKTLAAQNNASARALESAEAAAKRDAAQAESARAHLLAAMGKAIADRSDLTTFVQSLLSGEKALVRIDLPPGELLKNEPAGARIVPLGGEQNLIEAKFLGQTAAVDPQTQSQGYLFLIESNSEKPVLGTAVTGYLQVSGNPRNGVIVPRAAIVRNAGVAWVYLETDGTNFNRRMIAPGQPVENGWFVTEGVKAGDRVVVTGAQAVFSEELNGSGFMSGERE